MKFQDYPYVRPDETELMERLDTLNTALEQAETYENFRQAFFELDQCKRDLITMRSLAYIRHAIDTRDPFYDAEQEFFGVLFPKYSQKLSEAAAIILESPFLETLKKEVSPVYFAKIENAKKSTSEAIIPDLQMESKASSRYTKLIASAQIPFDGKVYTLAGLEEKMNDADESVRRRAHKAYWHWFEENEAALAEIFDELISIRTQMARKMGWDTFIPLGYLQMNRIDYDRNDVDHFRKNVLKDVVPAAQVLYKEQAERLGKETLKTWNEKVDFADGNPTPHFSTEEMKKRALQMYRELSPETGAFFQTMMDQELMDLDSKPGKRAGGFCSFLPNYEAPFILANFNKTSHDAEVLTHEAGHAFQGWSSKSIQPLECRNATMETCEIHSMSMEFFTWPWMELFFEEDAGKYRYQHLAHAVKFIPYGVLVDHFQHEVYAHPEWNHNQRMAAWRRLERQYLPHKDYDEIDILERGGWWLRQLHIFIYPFYYIDYTLAQTCALQFWKRLMDKDPTAFDDYKKICRLGGSLPFKQIAAQANLKDPFTDGCLKETMDMVLQFYQDHPADF